MHHLLDVNVYLAASFEGHLHHLAAKSFVDRIELPATMLFCRVTELACLRLPTQVIVPSFEPLSNRDSIAVYAAWHQDERVAFVEEPTGLGQHWPRLGLRDSPSTKLWTDAYLAGFAIAGRYRLVSFERGFRQFLGDGLDLQLLDPLDQVQTRSTSS